jgi:hypothetical protein
LTARSSVFEKTYNDYLEQVARLDIKSMEGKLGIVVEGKETIIPLLGRPQRVSKEDITGPSGERPSFEACVILCRYLILCPEGYPRDSRWVSYRDLKDSGPLTSYFENDVEKAITKSYSGKKDTLRMACDRLGGHPPDMEDLFYDISMQFELLPMVPLLMLYNDPDEEFPAKCSVLFEARAEDYLDAECLAMAGRLLFTSLKEADGKMHS